MWHVLIILLIPVAVVILASLFRGAEQRNKKDRPLAQGRESRNPSGRGGTDLDRFLEEARRRREAAERREAAGTRQEIEMPKPTPPPPRQKRQSRPTPPRPREMPEPTPRRKPVVLEEVPVARPVVVLAEPTPAQPVRPGESTSVKPVELAAPPPAPINTQPKAPSPVLQQVARMLRSPQSAASAIVLREIFDQPLSRRRR